MIYACVLGYQAYLFDNRLISGRRMAFSIAAFLGVTWFSNIVAFGIFKHSHISLAQALGPWTVIPLVFFAVTMTGLRNARWLNSGWVPLCGAASYSIYLLHPIGISLAYQYGRGDVLQFLFAVAATGLMAFVGYNYIERPGIGLGRKLVASLRSVKAGPLPAAQ
jgi:peptidoglycan/LPS O-acetylase OafA/YrhL